MYNLIFVDVSQFVTDPIRTGVQRVLVKILESIPRKRLMPFRVVDGLVAVLDPAIIEVFSRFFKKRTYSDRALLAKEDGLESSLSEEENLIRLIGAAPIALLDASRFFFRAQRVINLESFGDPERSRFYIACPPPYRDKVAHFVHDFLLFEQPQVFPQLNWRYAIDNILLFEAYCAAGGYFVSTPEMQKKVSRYFNRPLSHAVVVHFGGDISRSPSSSNIGGLDQISRQRRVLVVGTVEPRKYPLEVASALDEVAVRHPGTECIMAGSMGWLSAETRAVIESIFAGNRVIHLPQLGDIDLANLISGTDVAIYVSSTEGFGLPVIEYAARGIPLITNAAVPASEIIKDSRAIILPVVTVSSLVDAIERQLTAPVNRSSYYQQTWSNCAAEIIAWKSEKGEEQENSIDQSTCWAAAVRITRELRGEKLEWEQIKRRVRARLFPEDGTAGLISVDKSTTGLISTDLVEQLSEIVSDNLTLIYWADKLAVRGLLQEIVRCVTCANNLEGIARAYTSFLGRPMDARAASEVVKIEDTTKRLRRIVELINCDEASAYMAEATQVAVRSIVGEVFGMLDMVASAILDISQLCDFLGILPPTLDDVISADNMHAAGVSRLSVIMHFANRRAARGDAVDLLLEAMASQVLSQERSEYKKDIDLIQNRMRSKELSPQRSTFETTVGSALLNRIDVSDKASKDSPVVVSRRVPLHSALLSDGWFDVEMDEFVYRWMSKSASIVNPEPQRRLNHVRLLVSMVYGSDEPFLAATIDGERTEVRVEKRDAGDGWFVFIAADPGKRLHEILTLEAAITDSPARAENKSDERELSFALTECMFVYDSS